MKLHQNFKFSLKSALTVTSVLLVLNQPAWSAAESSASSQKSTKTQENQAEAGGIGSQMMKSIKESVADAFRAHPCDDSGAMLVKNNLGMHTAIENTGADGSHEVKEELISILAVSQNTNGEGFLRVIYGDKEGVTDDIISSNPRKNHKLMNRIFIKFPTELHRQLFQCMLSKSSGAKLTSKINKSGILIDRTEILEFTDIGIAMDGKILSDISLNKELAKYIPDIKMAHKLKEKVDKGFIIDQPDLYKYSDLNEFYKDAKLHMPNFVEFIGNTRNGTSSSSASEMYTLALWFEYLNQEIGVKK